MSTFKNVSSYKLSSYSRFNVSESHSDIHMFVDEFRQRVENSVEDNPKTTFMSFIYDNKPHVTEPKWVQDDNERFFKNTPNSHLSTNHYLSECGFICSMTYSTEGDFIIVGHSTGMIQMRHGSTGVVLCTLRNIQFPPKPVHALAYSLYEENICYAACMDGAVYRIEIPHVDTSVDDPPAYCIQADPMLESLSLQFYGSPGISKYSTPFITQRFPAYALGITADGAKMAAGYGDTSIKVYDMETQEAAVTYKVHKLRLQFIPKKLQRMHFGQVVALRTHPSKPYMFASGAWDKTLRIWDVRCKVGCVMTFEGVDICGDAIDLNDKTLLEKKEKCAIHEEYATFLSKFRRGNGLYSSVGFCVPVWREQCLAGSWKPTEAVTLWDLTARKQVNIIRIQNRRPDVDGEYIYCCRYWRSSDYNRKGKYGIFGGSGTSCLEVVNLHNRYIACSYPTSGTILAITSHQERIAFGGTSSAFNIVTFHDPKHEKAKYQVPVEADDYSKSLNVTALYQEEIESMASTLI